MQVVSRSHTGLKKERNEDRLLVQKISADALLLLVADGLGGHPGGDVAASLVVESIAQQCMESASLDLVAMLIAAGDTIMEYGAAHPEIDGMGSTASIALIRQDTVQWAHIGDGRIYHLDNGLLRCQTRDQTLSRALYDQGKIGWHEIGNHKLNHFLEQCMGEEDIVPDSGSFDFHPDDLILLNTDGLHDMLPDERIQKILSAKESLEGRADQLLQETLQAGGEDNVSFILAL